MMEFKSDIPSRELEKDNLMKRNRLYLAVRRNNYHRVLHLLRRKGNPNLKFSNGISLLHIAASKGSGFVSSLLLQHGADINAATNRFETPLHSACSHGQEHIVRVFVRNGGRLDVYDDHGCTPYDLAKIQGFEKCVNAIETFISNSQVKPPATKKARLQEISGSVSLNKSECDFGPAKSVKKRTKFKKSKGVRDKIQFPASQTSSQCKCTPAKMSDILSGASDQNTFIKSEPVDTESKTTSNENEYNLLVSVKDPDIENKQLLTVDIKQEPSDAVMESGSNKPKLSESYLLKNVKKECCVVNSKCRENIENQLLLGYEIKSKNKDYECKIPSSCKKCTFPKGDVEVKKDNVAMEKIKTLTNEIMKLEMKCFHLGNDVIRITDSKENLALRLKNVRKLRDSTSHSVLRKDQLNAQLSQMSEEFEDLTLKEAKGIIEKRSTIQKINELKLKNGILSLKFS